MSINLQAMSDLTKKTPTMDVKNSEADVAKAIKVAPATSYYYKYIRRLYMCMLLSLNTYWC